MSPQLLVCGLCFIVIFVQLVFTNTNDADSCKSKRFSLDVNHLNKRMTGHVMFNMSTIHHQCIRECMLRSACGSTNFFKSLCELNDKDSSTANGDIQPANGYIYTDITEWPMHMVGNCGDRPCNKHQVCVPAEAAFTCLNIDCGKPNILFSELNDTSTVYGPTVEVTCKRGFYLHGQSIIKCQADGRWSEKPECKRNCTTCKEIKTCNPGYMTDDYFWLSPAQLDTVSIKVYCHGMDTDEPKEYLTVNPDTNYMEDTGTLESGVRVFVRLEKIRLIIEYMTINQSDLMFGSRQTIHSSEYGGPDLIYGIAAGCTYGDLGSFNIDTSGTGLIIDETIEWRWWGIPTGEQTFLRSGDGTQIYGRCGGECAWCSPSLPLLLHHNPSDVVSGNGVKTPGCG